ncbi:MAG: hypothetical protein HC782_02305, partial [Gammaproteobacteria bacterium]|nr:hypothetical protein [Gammaproteobacteria bacterium]
SKAKALQIGITQSIQDEAFNATPPLLIWHNIGNSGRAAQLKVRSPGATAIRAAIKVTNLPNGAELRFAGSDAPDQVVHRANGLEIYTLIDDAKHYWTPTTDGDTQTLEIFIPTSVNAANIGVSVEAVSHIFASAKDGFKGATPLKGASGACNVDVICTAQTPAFVNAKNSVAHMVYQANCGANNSLASCICTGTLLNDTDTTTQIPFFTAPTIASAPKRKPPHLKPTGIMTTQLVQVVMAQTYHVRRPISLGVARNYCTRT